MDIQVIRRPRHTPNIASIGELVGKLGAPTFPDALFAEVRRFCGCAHFVALASTEHNPIKVIFATNEGPALLARETAEKYVADHWRYDPINALLPKLGAAVVSVRTTPQDIDSGQYRRDCYSRPRLTERLSLLRCFDGVTNRLHLYRAKGTGSFSDREIDAMSDASDILFALVAKHGEFARDPAKLSAAELRQRILLKSPDMPRREADVCAGIASGQTSEAIALSLGLSANTVLTYRKRAYARLRITSSNELLARIFSASFMAPRA